MCDAGRMSLNNPAQPMGGKGESVSDTAFTDQCQQAVNAPQEFRLSRENWGNKAVPTRLGCGEKVR